MAFGCNYFSHEEVLTLLSCARSHWATQKCSLCQLLFIFWTMNLQTDVNSSLISFQKNKGSFSPVLQSEMRKASCFPSSVGHQLWAESNATYLRPKLQTSSSSGNSAEEAWGSHKASEYPAHVLNYLQLGPGSLSWHMNKQGSGSLWHKNPLESRKPACNDELCIQECCGPPKGEH